MKLSITKKQQQFLDASADEVLFGGAAGGGKSYAQLIDALLYALRYPGSKQIMLRRTYPELEKSLIRVALFLYPAKLYRYNAARHMGRFANGSLIDFAYCDAENDVQRYQSAEYDVIRFDELTHFTETMYLTLLSRLRGANDFPKQVKSCTNPGGVGHSWVKARFIDAAPPGRPFSTPNGTRVFFPSLVQDNHFLMQADPGYLRRLQNLPPRERRALLHGDWELFEGQYFPEFSRHTHVVRPAPLPAARRLYRTLDYGLDMLACLWISVDGQGHAVVYRELYQPGLIISDAAEAILAADEASEDIFATLAPPDLWNRRQETGKSAADIFAENGILLTKTGNDRVSGWMAVKEWLKLRPNEQGGTSPRLTVFDTCANLIRTLPALQADPRNPCDAASHPHELTHSPDALRGFCTWWVSAAQPAPKARARWTSDMWEDYNTASARDRALLEKQWQDN